MNALKECCAKYKEYAALPIRVIFGLFFLAQGWGKLANIAGFTGMLAGWGVPAPTAMAWIVGLIELLGGLALLLGLWVELAGILLGIVMLVAIAKVTWANGFTAPGGYGLNLLIIAGLLSVMFSGPGKLTAMKGK